MTNAGLLARMLRAAETWGRTRYGRELIPVAHTEPARGPDGTLQVVVIWIDRHGAASAIRFSASW